MDNGEWIKLAATIAASVTALKGIAEYAKSNKIKRIDLLNTLVNEFNGANFFMAKRMLDDFEIKATDSNIIFYKDHFNVILRDHRVKEIENDQTLIAVRDSFDNLFEFFTKLEYLLSLGLISKNEFFYFRYYLNRVFQDGYILNFCQVYEYSSIFRLKYIFGFGSVDRTIWGSKVYRFKAWMLRNFL